MTPARRISSSHSWLWQLAATAAREGDGAKSGFKKVALFKYQFSQLAWTALIIFLCVFQLTFVTQHILEGVFWFFMPCSLVVMNDTSAYFCGFFMGKKFIKRPLTALSPNKTWEGFMGAIVLTCLWGWFVADALSHYSWMICPRRTYEIDGAIHTILTRFHAVFTLFSRCFNAVFTLF